MVVGIVYLVLVLLVVIDVDMLNCVIDRFYHQLVSEGDRRGHLT